jgi:hypothetical protein
VNWNFSKPTSKELLGDWQGALMVDEFAGSEAAGQRAAAIQSLLETARLNAYLYTQLIEHVSPIS